MNDEFGEISQSIEKKSAQILEDSISKESLYSQKEPKEPKECYGLVREKLLEAEIEKEESKKNVEFLKKKREEEKREMIEMLEKTKQEESKKAESAKLEMEERYERQILMLEKLVQDKKSLQDRLEEAGEKFNESEKNNEKQKQLLEQNFKVELKKNKDAWSAAELVRKEKWEKEKIMEIR